MPTISGADINEMQGLTGVAFSTEQAQCADRTVSRHNDGEEIVGHGPESPLIISRNRQDFDPNKSNRTADEHSFSDNVAVIGVTSHEPGGESVSSNSDFHDEIITAPQLPPNEFSWADQTLEDDMDWNQRALGSPRTWSAALDLGSSIHRLQDTSNLADDLSGNDETSEAQCRIDAESGQDLDCLTCKESRSSGTRTFEASQTPSSNIEENPLVKASVPENETVRGNLETQLRSNSSKDPPIADPSSTKDGHSNLTSVLDPSPALQNPEITSGLGTEDLSLPDDLRWEAGSWLDGTNNMVHKSWFNRQQGGLRPEKAAKRKQGQHRRRLLNRHLTLTGRRNSGSSTVIEPSTLSVHCTRVDGYRSYANSSVYTIPSSDDSVELSPIEGPCLNESNRTPVSPIEQKVLDNFKFSQMPAHPYSNSHHETTIREARVPSMVKMGVPMAGSEDDGSLEPPRPKTATGKTANRSEAVDFTSMFPKADLITVYDSIPKAVSRDKEYLPNEGSMMDSLEQETPRHRRVCSSPASILHHQKVWTAHGIDPKDYRAYWEAEKRTVFDWADSPRLRFTGDSYEPLILDSRALDQESHFKSEEWAEWFASRAKELKDQMGELGTKLGEAEICVAELERQRSEDVKEEQHRTLTLQDANMALQNELNAAYEITDDLQNEKIRRKAAMTDQAVQTDTPSDVSEMHQQLTKAHAQAVKEVVHLKAELVSLRAAAAQQALNLEKAFTALDQGKEKDRTRKVERDRQQGKPHNRRETGATIQETRGQPEKLEAEPREETRKSKHRDQRMKDKIQQKRRILERPWNPASVSLTLPKDFPRSSVERQLSNYNLNESKNWII